jgi:hypothetical protein
MIHDLIAISVFLLGIVVLTLAVSYVYETVCKHIRRK